MYDTFILIDSVVSIRKNVGTLKVTRWLAKYYNHAVGITPSCTSGVQRVVCMVTFADSKESACKVYILLYLQTIQTI